MLFKNNEQLEQEKIEKEKMEKEFESDRQREWKDSSLKAKIEKDYSKMISDLESGKVKPDAYLENEGLNLTEGEITDLGSSKAFQALWEQKFLLKAAREQATEKWARMNALEKTIGKSVDPLNFERLEKSLPADLMEEYQRRMLEEMNPEPEQEKLSPKTEAKDLKEVEESQVDEPEEEQEDEPEEEPEPDDRNTEYQI